MTRIGLPVLCGFVLGLVITGAVIERHAASQVRESITRVVAERQHAIDCAVQGRPVDACCRPCVCASAEEAR
jgi:hypothetical protein